MRVEGGPHGWLVVDKPLGVSSHRVVERVRRATGAKAGHAGTLDPLATGVLPIALGEATKTIAYAMTGRKRYRFRIRWGIARATDDREGEVVNQSPARPSSEAIEAMLPRFVGMIEQVPPLYSALKVNGRRAYALARNNVAPALMPRLVEIRELRLLGIPDPDHADCEALVGKGTYIRALARDIGVALGTFGHVAELRRLSVGCFTESQAVALDFVAEQGHILAQTGCLLPIETALDDIPAVALSEAEAARLRCGQKLVRSASEWGESRNFDQGSVVGAWHNGALVALASVEHRYLRPLRVIKSMKD